eukprot:766833-Hanusia_phi.AAC.2
MARTARGSGRTTVMMAATGAAGASKARDSEASDRRGDRDEIESGGRKGGEQGHGGLFAEQEKERALAAEEVKVRARRKLMEMLAFIVFLVLFTCNALMQRPVEASHDFSKEFTAATLEGASFSSTTYFKGIRDVGTVDDFWTWMVECPMQYLYIDRSYNGSLFGPDFQGTTWRVNGNNVIVQRPRLRQVRVEPQTCKIPKRMKAKVGYGDQQTCIPKVQDAEIDKTTWWALELNSSFVMVQRPVPFYSASQLSSSSFTSRASGSPLSYDGGGFIQVSLRPAVLFPHPLLLSGFPSQHVQRAVRGIPAGLASRGLDGLEDEGRVLRLCGVQCGSESVPLNEAPVRVPPLRFRSQQQQHPRDALRLREAVRSVPPGPRHLCLRHRLYLARAAHLAGVEGEEEGVARRLVLHRPGQHRHLHDHARVQGPVLQHGERLHRRVPRSLRRRQPVAGIASVRVGEGGDGVSAEVHGLRCFGMVLEPDHKLDRFQRPDHLAEVPGVPAVPEPGCLEADPDPGKIC